MKYSFGKYVYLERWSSYWRQINEVLKTNPKNVLVIGKGDGVVDGILRKYVSEVITLDIDKELKPDIVASVENMPIEKDKMDIVLCAEVLEHLPFEKLEKSLAEISRVSSGQVVLSLPHFGPPVKLSFKIPFAEEIKIAFKIPFPIKHKFNGEHCWEIGKRNYSPTRIRKIIKKYFTVKKEFVSFENQYHRFYILDKK